MPFSRAQSFKFQWDFNYTLSELRGYKKKKKWRIISISWSRKKKQNHNAFRSNMYINMIYF